MPKKILIVDDEPSIVVPLEFLMKQCGFQVFVARNGEDALKRFSEHTPDLILLDIMLPGQTGFDICQTIRENMGCKTVKIIMLTARSREVDIAKGMAFGANAYITKPFSNTEIVKKVKELLADS